MACALAISGDESGKSIRSYFMEIQDRVSKAVTKEELDALSTCDLNATINDGLSIASREQLKNKTGEEIVKADIENQMKRQ